MLTHRRRLRSATHSFALRHIVRPSACRRGAGVPCDPVLVLPFGSLAFVLTVVGSLALLLAATLIVALVVRGVIRLDARERQARHR